MKKLSLFFIICIGTVSMALQSKKEDLASKFLSSLNAEQRTKALLDFNHESKPSWHYFPSTMFERAGISLAELNIEQKAALFKLLKNSLSQSGYDKALKIIDLENVLAALSGNASLRDPEKYYAAFYGNPAKDPIWAWSFEGHHLSLNFTIDDQEISIAPRFMGANPATIPNGPRKGERTLREEDRGFELLNSLNEEQKQKAIFREEAFPNIITTNKEELSPLDPVGIKFEALQLHQRSILLHLIDVYLSSMPAALAKKRMEKLKTEELNQIRFGWAGATSPGIGHYYRVQGKSFLIEFDNTQNKANHIHTVWRDFDGDFGRDLIKEHYHNADHHH
ncbi:DUF3500 domain-containing protein [Echinicola marina]|uniref:DUF3500 domain-containing protein n=1 Tax=Echinicola marina TaxID=2859768 RepID=UPI001CF60A51|nr:DUF3500 domain-containing protein [Echinicola marina]UCS92765.1 DUF3500 domain-containing protein [Echinicola marina]